MKVKEVKDQLDKINVEAHVHTIGDGYVQLHLKPQDVEPVAEVLPIYGIGVGFCYNTGTYTFQIG